MARRTLDPKLEILRQVPLFNGCRDKELQQLGSLMDEMDAPEGYVLIREGHPGRECFVVADGEVAVEVDGREIARLGPGEIVGEMSLIDNEARSATAVCATRTRLFVLDVRSFARLMAEHETVARKVLRILVHRLRDAEVVR